MACEQVTAFRGQTTQIILRCCGKAKERKKILSSQGETSKEGYDHFTHKEIHEQSDCVRAALAGRSFFEYGTAYFDPADFGGIDLQEVERILILACGTSYHAGLIGAMLIEEEARIPVQVELSSEFRYKNPVIEKGTLALAISQSGETADTLAALKDAGVLS